jgi:hypothetical protein
MTTLKRSRRAALLLAAAVGVGPSLGCMESPTGDGGGCNAAGQACGTGLGSCCSGNYCRLGGGTPPSGTCVGGGSAIRGPDGKTEPALNPDHDHAGLAALPTKRLQLAARGDRALR